MINVALVGCGRIAQRHAQLLGDAQIDGARLVAVCDTVAERAQALSHRYDVPSYTNMNEMLDRHQPDLAAILTESGYHAKHAISAAKEGVNVMVEKPMALTLADADQMIETCDHAGVKLFVVKQNRFNRPVVKLRQALEGGRFGKLTMGTVRVRWCRPQHYYDQAPWRGTWALDGGVLTNQASHHVDLLEWMMGDVESVVGMTRTALADIEAEDTAAVLLRFANGALGIIEATTATRPKDLEGSLSILGEAGSVEIGGFAVNQMKTWQFTHEEPGDDEVFEKYSVNPPDVYGFGHRAYYDHVVTALRHGGPNLVDGIEGRRSLELITAIYEAVETGQEVRLRFRPRQARLGMRS
ncbi:Gfo/Idh/MocA family protein [Roseovarius sp.]|uniref:Gfo/Idh/MocA family protein n=1 Tax=Roseovarius sp. TaxID=1486281 RepID=UPI003BAB964E